MAVNGFRGGRGGTNVFSMSDYDKVIEIATEGDNLIGLKNLEFCWDFESLLGHVLPGLQGHGAGQRANFTFEDSVTWMRFRARTSDGDGGRRVHMKYRIGYDHHVPKSVQDDCEGGWLPLDRDLGYEVTGLDSVQIHKEGPGFVPFSSRVLDEHRVSRVPKLLSQFEAGRGCGILGAHGATERGARTIEEWKDYRESIPKDVETRVDQLRAEGTLPDFRFPTFEEVRKRFSRIELTRRDGGAGTDEIISYKALTNHDIAIRVVANLKDKMQIDPVTTNPEEKRKLEQRKRGYTKELQDLKEMSSLQQEALSQQWLSELVVGELVVVACIGNGSTPRRPEDERLSFGFAKVLETRVTGSGSEGAGASDSSHHKDIVEEVRVHWYNPLSQNPELWSNTEDNLIRAVDSCKFLP